eukprot:3464477-Ditylum_brightwellii.AAC.1
MDGVEATSSSDVDVGFLYAPIQWAWNKVRLVSISSSGATTVSFDRRSRDLSTATLDCQMDWSVCVTMAGVSQCPSSVIRSSSVGGHISNARICPLKPK